MATNYNRLCTLLKEYGFSPEAIASARYYYVCRNRREDTLLDNLTKLLAYLEEYGMKREDIISIFSKNPSLLHLRKEYMQDKLAFFEEIGFTKDRIIKSFKKCVWLLNASLTKLRDRVRYFDSLGLDKNYQLRMYTFEPQILTLSDENISLKEEWASEHGINLPEYAQVVKISPQFLGYSLKLLDDHWNFYRNLGLTDEETKKIVVKTPPLIITRSSEIENRIERLKNLLSNPTRINRIIVNDSQILKISPKTLEEHISIFQANGFTAEEISYFLEKGSFLFSIKLDSLQKRIDLYDYYGFRDWFIQRPRAAFQSVELTLAMINYLEVHGYEINPYYIFGGSNLFKNTYGVSITQVKEEYAKVEELL